MSIARKLILMVAVGQAALIFITLFSWHTAYSIDRGYREMLRNDYRQVELAMESLDRLGKAVQAYKNNLVRKDPKYVDEFNQECSFIENSLKKCYSVTDGNEKKLVEHALQRHSTYRDSIVELVRARATNDDIVWVDKNVSQGIDKPVRTALEQLAETSRANISNQIAGLQHTARNKFYIQAVIATVVGSFLLAFGIILIRNISGRLNTFAGTIGMVAEKNDLTVAFDDCSKDEVGRLAGSFRNMAHNLRQVITVMAKSASDVSIVSVKMQANAQQMSQSADGVASQAITLAAASEEMSATAGSIAQNCHFAAESAKRADEAADHGASVVENSIAVMQRIAEQVRLSTGTVEALGRQSDEIGSIICTIEAIADQTNLLALNAAIEAARAGDQGRGFAVVADEVRALAERTAQATQEIGQMINAIQQETRTAVAVMEKGVAEVEFGTAEAARSGEALHVIRDEIRTVNQQVQQIAIAAEEQTATTHEISANIQRITDVVHGTADGAHQTLTAAETLSALSNDFKGIVGRFRVGNRLDSVKDQAAALSIRCTETLERAVNDGRISMNELFSTDYKAVPHTNPQKYTTTFDRLFDDSISPLQEEIVTRDGTISYAICVDRSGYCPSHNKRFTRPLTGNELQDRDGNRTKRIFNDATGLRAATNSEPFLLQSYLRDTGEVMSDLSTPLMIGGKQWGAVRIGFLCDES